MKQAHSGKVDRKTRRDQVAMAALSIVSSCGVKGVTTAALAREVGISEANLYRHFKNKNEILLETVAKIGDGLRKNMEIAFSLPIPPHETLKKIFELHLEHIESNPGIPRLIFSEEIHIGNELLRQELLKTITGYTSKLESLIKKWQDEGSLKAKVDPSAAALMFLGMIQALTMKWSLSGFNFKLTEAGMKLWANYERCLKSE